eukprot:jgi/Chrpa1/27458/Chrysochromulina_OHIO_Genome00025746-RA
MPLPPSPPPQPPLLPPPLPCTVLPCTAASDNDVPGLYSVQHLPSHGRALLTSVSTVDGLDIALANTAVTHIVLSAGTYYLSAELRVTRSVVIEAAVAGSVVLDAQASSSSQRRVLNINPGSSGVVQLIGLNITGGYTDSSGGGVLVWSGAVTFTSCRIYGNTATIGGNGGGVLVWSGAVTFTLSSIYSNTADYSGGGVLVWSG